MNTNSEQETQVSISEIGYSGLIMSLKLFSPEYFTLTLNTGWNLVSIPHLALGKHDPISAINYSKLYVSDMKGALFSIYQD